MLEKQLLLILSMLKTVVLLHIFVETIIHACLYWHFWSI